VNQQAMERYVAALQHGTGLHDDFIYSMTFDEYKSFPDPFPRTTFSMQEVQETIYRYPNPAESQELFQWDIHGRLFTPAYVSIPAIAVVMIHGGAANEYEFIFTPDGPEEYLDRRAGKGPGVSQRGLRVQEIRSARGAIALGRCP